VVRRGVGGRVVGDLTTRPAPPRQRFEFSLGN